MLKKRWKSSLGPSLWPLNKLYVLPSEFVNTCGFYKQRKHCYCCEQMYADVPSATLQLESVTNIWIHDH